MEKQLKKKLNPSIKAELAYSSDRIRRANREIHRELGKSQTELVRKFHDFFSAEIASSMLPIESIRRIHQNRIRAIIRSSIESPYFTGNQTVSKHLLERNPNFVYYTSGRDIENIKNISERMNEQFWIRTGKLLQRLQGEFKNDTDSEQTIRKREFNIEAAMLGLAIHVIYGGYNSAVKSKLSQIELDGSGVGVSAATVKGTIRTLAHSRKSHVIFVTKHDAKVDPQICAPLNGTIWEIDDPDIIIPPFDTHYYCRCVLQPLDVSEESSFLPFVE